MTTAERIVILRRNFGLTATAAILGVDPAEVADFNEDPSDVPTAEGSDKGVCIYDADEETYTRPSGYGSVEFVGPVDPEDEAEDNDTWIDTSA